MTSVTAAAEQLSLAICAVQVDPEAAKSFENLILAGAITVMRTVSAVGNERQMCSQKITDAAYSISGVERAGKYRADASHGSVIQSLIESLFFQGCCQ